MQSYDDTLCAYLIGYSKSGVYSLIVLTYLINWLQKMSNKLTEQFGCLWYLFHFFGREDFDILKFETGRKFLYFLDYASDEQISNQMLFGRRPALIPYTKSKSLVGRWKPYHSL